jgi:hypothetical protein
MRAAERHVVYRGERGESACTHNESCVDMQQVIDRDG